MLLKGLSTQRKNFMSVLKKFYCSLKPSIFVASKKTHYEMAVFRICNLRIAGHAM